MRAKKYCYIAGAIGALPEEEYTANFKKAKVEVHELGFIPISPLDLPHNHGKTYGEFMKEDIRAMLAEDCGTVYVLKNFRHSPGALQEIQTALFCGLNIIHQQ